MSLPLFYTGELMNDQASHVLDEMTSRHVVQVLRMKKGDRIHLTDGRGSISLAEISVADKKHCSVNILSSSFQDPPARKIHIAISLLNNTNRFEWFLEKATEIGVGTIIPLLCERTGKQKIRSDRMNQILVSAMLQSQQAWLPNLEKPLNFEDYVKNAGNMAAGESRFIAHCLDGEKISLGRFEFTGSYELRVLIGPEGDFTITEIELAIHNGFKPVSLGNNRLRSETAGIAALILLNN